MAGEIKAAGEPFPGGNIQHRPTLRCEPAEEIDRRPESVGVQRNSVADSPEIRQRRRVAPAADSRVVEAAPPIMSSAPNNLP